MKFAFLFFIYYANLCFGVRLNPLENNDKLQGISNQYIAGKSG